MGVHVLFLVGSLIVAEFVARAGGCVLPWWRSARRPFLTRWGLAVLVGLAGWGLAFLGLALTGLFFPGILIATGVAMGLALPSGRRLECLTAGAGRAWGAVGRLPAAALAVAGLLVACPALVRETSFDSLVYHLGVPWQFLQAHRAILSDIQLQFQFSLPVEMVFGLPVALGDDRFARMLMVLAFAAGNAVFAGRMLEKGRPGPAWVGPLLVLAAPVIAWVASLSKSDSAAAAYLVAGALLTAEGGWGLGALLLGCAVAAKLSYAPMVVIWCLVMRPGSRRIPRLMLGLVLPGIAWWVKAWLATGTPAFPFTSALIPSPFWGAMNQAAWQNYVQADWPADTISLVMLPFAWVRHMAGDYLLALLLLPLLFVFAGRRGIPSRMVMAGVVVAMLATLATGHLTRFLIPLVWWTCLMAADVLDALPGVTGRLAGPLLASLVAVELLWDPAGHRPGWRLLAGAPVAVSQGTTPVDQALAQLSSLHARRVLSVGELRSYRIPGRIIFDGAIGETPVIWRIAHESRTVGGIRRKLRQTGARWMLYNLVSVQWPAIRYHVFPWSDRALRLYVEFCRRYHRIAWRSDTIDDLTGGFYLIELAASPVRKPPQSVWFAPGIEMIWGQGIVLNNALRPQEALRTYLVALNRAPDVGAIWNLVGFEYAVLGDVASARRYLDRFARQGMVDDINWSLLASVDFQLGRLDEAAAAARRAIELYPTSRKDLVELLAEIERGRQASAP